jgi:histidinol-phosphate/aromatic aminotransferase/cobyric acid decarboxylase-like protein
VLDLRWIVEEPALQEPPLDELFAEVTGRLGVDGARAYHLDDPYGGARLGAALGLPPQTVTAGAGVSSLLAALGAAAAGSPVTTAAHGHPDLPFWAAERGSPVLAHASGDGAGPGGVSCVDRPAADGTVMSRHALRRLAASCALLVVDESYAAYLDPAKDPAERSVAWAAGTPNVVVLGGLSKGYGLGGLRIGWMVASPDTTARLRRYVPPLQVSALSVALAAAVLADPARLDPLRAKVRHRKPEFVSLLVRAGLRPRVGHPAVPWVCLAPADAARLADRGIAGKPCAAVDDAHWRFVVPLADDRWARALGLLGP